MVTKKKRVLSGIQSSGKLHLGNYLGAVRHHIELAKEYDAIYMIADMHALTTVQDAEKMRYYIREIALDYLALGLDPKKSILFVQSDVPEHAELAWILSCVTPHGLLARSHAFKDAQQKHKNATAGLFSYPVLMAADILLYGADMVPVGRDQRQHIEIARDIAGYFNNVFNKEVFKLPEPLIYDEDMLVLGVDNRKMSKSYGNTVDLFADEETTKKQIRSMMTDPNKIKLGDRGNPDICNVFTLHGLLGGDDVDFIHTHCKKGDLGCVDCKDRLRKTFSNLFQEAKERRVEVEKKKLVEDFLQDGAKRASVIAKKTMGVVYKCVGF